MNTEKAPPELKPCPFCGAEPQLISIPVEVHYYVMCIECGASGSDLHGKQDAIDAWNTRASSPAAEAKCVEGEGKALPERIWISPDKWEPSISTTDDGGIEYVRASTITAIAAREAAEEIARRWFDNDLTQRAMLMSSKRQQLRNLAEDIIAKHCSPVSGDVISRAEAIRVVDELAMDIHNEDAGASDVIERLRALPAVQPVAAGADESRIDRLECQIKGLMNCLANSQQEVEELRGRVAAGGWSPIESAPKDGTIVLIAYPEYGVGPELRVASAGYYQNGWKGCSTDKDWYFPPSYWQPLPAPPAALEAVEVKGEK